MNNFQMIPRSVYFKDGIAISTHPSNQYDSMEVIMLPTDHYDFIGFINPIGKTKDEIEECLKKFWSGVDKFVCHDPDHNDMCPCSDE